MSDAEGVVDQEVAQPPVEEMLPQSKVNELVGAAKLKEREKAEAQYKSELEKVRNVGGMQSQGSSNEIDYDEVVRKATEAMESKLQEQREQAQYDEQKKQIDKLAKDYLEKMSQGAELYDDFEETVSDFNPKAFPQVTLLAAQQDNLPDIMYDLMKNPTKLTHLHLLALESPELARKEMTKLSKSIKRNEDAVANNVKSPAPLSRTKNSINAGSDSGKRTIRDLRQMDYLKV